MGEGKWAYEDVRQEGGGGGDEEGKERENYYDRKRQNKFSDASRTGLLTKQVPRSVSFWQQQPGLVLTENLSDIVG